MNSKCELALLKILSVYVDFFIELCGFRFFRFFVEKIEKSLFLLEVQSSAEIRLGWAPLRCPLSTDTRTETEGRVHLARFLRKLRNLSNS